MQWMAIVVSTLIGTAGAILMLRRRRQQDLGSVSEEWIARYSTAPRRDPTIITYTE